MMSHACPCDGVSGMRTMLDALIPALDVLREGARLTVMRLLLCSYDCDCDITSNHTDM